MPIKKQKESDDVYSVTVPVMLGAPAYDHDRITAVLKQVHAQRVLIALPPLRAGEDEAMLASLQEEIQYFQQQGFLTGVWYWALWVEEGNEFTPVHGKNGKSATEKCPLDERFLAFAAHNIQRIAAMKPEMILFDDDLRLGFMDSGFGCVCPHHQKLLQGAGFDNAFTELPNEYRSRFLSAMGESLKRFCIQMRSAVNEVAPEVRIGLCACLSTWDTDGVDSYTLATLLAGNTKPYIRLIGAPYWAVHEHWGNRLQDAVELERMERSWTERTDMEIVSEGDTYPRPRFVVPASYLEIFDTALRFSGGFSGIQKYMLDYCSSCDYEFGYVQNHIRNEALYRALEETAAPLPSVGIRVYESMHKLEQAHLTDEQGREPDMFFSPAARLLAEHGFPSTYTGTGCAGIAFGENARHLPPEAFTVPLILDEKAARILTEQGKDVGVKDFGEAISVRYERFGKECASVFNDLDSAHSFAHRITLQSGAEVLSEFVSPDGTAYPASWRYQSNDGCFIVLGFSAFLAPESVTRQYTRAYSLKGALRECGVNLPAVAAGHPDLYVQCKREGETTVIGLWNCSADAIENLVIETDRFTQSASAQNLHGTVAEKHITVTHLPAFGYGFMRLTDSRVSKNCNF